MRKRSSPIKRTRVYIINPRTHGGAPRIFKLTHLCPRLKIYTVRLAEKAIPIKDNPNRAPVRAFLFGSMTARLGNAKSR